MVNKNENYFDVSAKIKVLEGMLPGEEIEIARVLENGEDKGQRIEGYEMELRKALGDRRDDYALTVEERGDRGTNSFKWSFLMAERIR